MTQLSDQDRELLLQAFFAQTAEALDGLESSVVALEQAPHDDELLNGIFRAAHSLKGDALIVGFRHVAEVAHALEDLLSGLRDHERALDAGVASAVLGAVDALRSMLAGAARDGIEGTGLKAAAIELLRGVMVRGPHEDAAAATEGAGSLAPSPAELRTLRVDVAKLDKMLDLAGEMAIARGRTAGLLERVAGPLHDELVELHREAERLQLELQEQVMRARMVAIGPFLRRYARTVREMARGAGKEATLEIDGGEAEVDTRVLELLRDPLTHMIRNAVDHGLESPEVRAAAGKPAAGRITLAAAHEAGRIVLRVRDDGAGFALDRIRRRAAETGLATDPELLPQGELLRLVFEPGFSTAESVTDLSGRGVGMDVVRRNIESLRGTIDIDTVEGSGSEITIRLPLTLAIIDGFGVGVGEERYVLPLTSVLECLTLPAARREDGAGAGVLDLRGAPLPYVRLRDLFALGGQAPAREHVVVVEHEGGRTGLVVDTLHGEGQVVIKSLGRGLDAPAGLAGSTILGSGRVALILDVPTLVRRAQARVTHTHEGSPC
ncbi:MAG TPA: chemotaxis protein CheA [Gemmatimonadales bacterium]|nr:chemotaxis protein CheA [Gemmatimonadales bacterium]